MQRAIALALGVGFLSTTFQVSARPHPLDDGTWAMTVDGVELKKTGERAPQAAGDSDA